MADTLVTIEVPEPLYRRLQGAAAAAHRTVADVLTSAVTVALPPSPDLPAPLAAELAEMIWLSDDALRAATQPAFTAQHQERLALLNATADERRLSIAEQQERLRLVDAYEYAVLRRAQAFAILQRRGHAIPDYGHRVAHV